LLQAIEAAQASDLEDWRHRRHHVGKVYASASRLVQRFRQLDRHLGIAEALAISVTGQGDVEGLLSWLKESAKGARYSSGECEGFIEDVASLCRRAQAVVAVLAVAIAGPRIRRVAPCESCRSPEPVDGELHDGDCELRQLGQQVMDEAEGLRLAPVRLPEGALLPLVASLFIEVPEREGLYVCRVKGVPALPEVEALVNALSSRNGHRKEAETA
jgi:hypothetical protein